MFVVARKNNAVKMSGGHDVLAMKDDDVTKMLAASVHVGEKEEDVTQNINHQMRQYVFKTKQDGECGCYT